LGRTRVCLGGFAACKRGGCTCALAEGASKLWHLQLAAGTARNGSRCGQPKGENGLPLSSSGGEGLRRAAISGMVQRGRVAGGRRDARLSRKGWEGYRERSDRLGPQAAKQRRAAVSGFDPGSAERPDVGGRGETESCVSGASWGSNLREDLADHRWEQRVTGRLSRSAVGRMLEGLDPRMS